MHYLLFRSGCINVFGAEEFEVWNWFFSVEKNYGQTSLSSLPFKKKVDILFVPRKNPSVCLCVCLRFEIRRPSQRIPSSSSMKCVWSGLAGVMSHVISCWLQCQYVMPGRLAGFGRGNETQSVTTRFIVGLLLQEVVKS